MGNDEQVAEGAEGVMEAENGNEVPSAHSHSIQLTSSQGGATKGLVTRPAKTSSPSTASWFTSMASQYTSTTPYIPSNNTPVPPHDFHEHSVSHRLHPSTPLSASKRCSYLSPPFHRLKNIRGRQLSRSQLCTPMVSKGCHTSLSTCQPTPSQTPPSTPCQRLHHAQNDPSRTLPLRADPTVESKGCSSSLTPNTFTPFSSKR